MMFKRFGKYLNLMVEGASHAPKIRFTLDNFPAGFKVDRAALAAFMARRAPGRDALSTQRHEADRIQFSTGIDAAGRTESDLIIGDILNTDVRPSDYGTTRTIPRPGHADFPQWVEMGRIPTGGGANSGRMTAALCAAGGICKQYLEAHGIRVHAEIVSVGGKTKDFEKTIRAAQKAGDSVGGVIRGVIEGLPIGLGGALFEGVEGDFSTALFGIPGVKGVAFGNGFEATALRGSENNDAFTIRKGRVVTETNRHGGVLGGRTSGMPLEVQVAFKPTPTVFIPEKSVDLATGKKATCEMKGRHDPCIVRRAVPVVEAVLAYEALDLILAKRQDTSHICLTLTGKTAEENRRQLEREWYFTDMVELRVDLLSEADRTPRRVTAFARSVGKPVILTYRRKKDGGTYTGSEKMRAAFFRMVLKKGCGFAYVDFEDDFRVKDLTRRACEAGVRIIRSAHYMKGLGGKLDGKRLEARIREMRGETDEIPKIAFLANDVREAVDLIQHRGMEFEGPRIVCAMGAKGFLSRVLSKRVSSFITYASTGDLRALGHVSPTELVRTYRIRSTSRGASLFAVTGWPLAFTRSPEIHNAAFADMAADALMVPIPTERAEEAIELMDLLYLRGMAVTYPHKEAIIPLLDGVDAAARAIGAVNTVVCPCCSGGKKFGFNTDAAGFAEALKRFTGAKALRGRRAAVIGAGGAARAVVYALKTMGLKVCVFNRTPEKAAALAAAFGCKWAALGPQSADTLRAYSDIIVQAAAPGGCSPERFDPLAFYAFDGHEYVYDLVYEPDVTPTLARAKAAGCPVENGFSMLEAQARLQRKIFIEECDI